MTITDETTKTFHSEYCRVTGRELPLTFGMKMIWERWQFQRFTLEDLRLVVSYIKALIKQRRRYPESFKLTNLISDTDKFAEDLAEAKAWKRNQPRAIEAKEKMLNLLGRTMEKQDTAKPASQIVPMTPEQWEVFAAKCKKDAGLME